MATSNFIFVISFYESLKNRHFLKESNAKNL
jgi:hypothetical protein